MHAISTYLSHACNLYTLPLNRWLVVPFLTLCIEEYHLMAVIKSMVVVPERNQSKEHLLLLSHDGGLRSQSREHYDMAFFGNVDSADVHL